jgi:glutamate-ammonia-ligase adenylyltransferase
MGWPEKVETGPRLDIIFVMTIQMDRLIDGTLPEPESREFMSAQGFVDPGSAAQRLQRIAGRDPATRRSVGQLLPHLFPALTGCADPDQALINLERFADAVHGAEAIGQLGEYPRALEILIAIFSGSQFLAEILVREPRHLDVLIQRERLARRKQADQFEREAMQAMGAASPDDAPDVLRNYQRGELLRIGTSDLLDLYDLPAVTSQLSNLTDGMVRAALAHASGRTGISSAGFVVLAMGKLGGGELNYSSDIDLLFLCSERADDFLRLGQGLIQTLSGITSLGFLYRVDMRLRPWGRDGALVVTADGYLDYLKKHARLWEKQALLKARPIAGDMQLGQACLVRAEPVIFGSPPEEIRSSVFEIKQRTEQILLSKGHDWGEVKLGEGSIRDIEFVVQYLQLAFGGEQRDIRSGATLPALPRLAGRGLLTVDEQRVLTDGYVFLRTLEHYLQLMHYQQTHALPSAPGAIQLLARRLGFQGPQAGVRFVERYTEHCQAIRRVYLRHVGDEPAAEPESPSSTQVRQHLSRLDTSYSNVFTAEEIERHAVLAQGLDDETPVAVEAVPVEAGTWRVTIVGYDFPGELSVICGLLFVHGFNILDGNVFTYEPVSGDGRASDGDPAQARVAAPRRSGARSRTSPRPEPDASDPRRKIVDVFTVKSVFFEPPNARVWTDYASDLNELLGMMRQDQRREARGQLAKRVGTVFQALPGKPAPLYTIDIEIDNEISDRYTVLHIDAPDTIGFLYEFTNALAFTRTYIARMIVRSEGNRARDTLYVTDAGGNKITSPERQRELRAAAVLIKHFTHLLPRSPNPEAALLHFREFIYQLFQRPNWPDEIASLERSEVLGALARVLGVSEFLWDDFLRMQYANLFPVVSDMDALSTAKARAELERELDASLEHNRVGEADYPDWRAALNAFKDRELFRIDMRHILSLTGEFWDFAAELADLAEVVVGAAYARCQNELGSRHGFPALPDGRPCPMAVLALGKCGGRELGFASDIELMFVYEGNGATSGPEVIDNADFFEKLVHDVVSSIHARQEGIFHVDLQLRPYGKAGSLAVPLDSFRKYYAPDGPAWAYERQALVKLRPIAGNEVLGNQVGELRDAFVYRAGTFDETAMRAMRERQIRHLVKGGTFNAKFSPGGLVDIEYLVQGLQIMHGAANPALRSTNLRAAMSALHEAGILSEEDHTRLRKAHTFLRWLIDSLRVVRGNTKEVTMPPYGGEEFAFLARRLLYENDIDRLRDDLARYVGDVLEINGRLLDK